MELRILSVCSQYAPAPNSFFLFDEQDDTDRDSGPKRGCSSTADHRSAATPYQLLGRLALAGPLQTAMPSGRLHPNYQLRSIWRLPFSLISPYPIPIRETNGEWTMDTDVNQDKD